MRPMTCAGRLGGWAAERQIEALTPTTNAGRAAKAQAALWVIKDHAGLDTTDNHIRFAIATLRDVAGSAVA
jgi:hypothetical protein